jgi:hypothetical protein
MNGGGGVFATGDHEDLGTRMCGKVPRVRSMRKWLWNGTIDPAYAPSHHERDRHDTLRPSRQGVYRHENQGDQTPQELFPRRFSSGAGIAAVHPILQGPNRVAIHMLPDHTHEGNCVKPATLTDKYEFGSVKGDDYPLSADGVRVSPEVLGDTIVIAGHKTVEDGDTYPQTDFSIFGAISAYDGHRARVGRVVTESTWHHFMDVNIIELLKVPVYQAILSAYYANIAYWLARPPQQLAMIVEGFQAALQRYPLAEIVPDGDPSAETVSGVAAAVAAGVTTRKCLGELEPHITATLLANAGAIVDPFAGINAEPPAHNPFFDPDVVVDVAVGGAMLQFVKMPTAEAAIQGAQAALAALPNAVTAAASAFVATVAPGARS